MSKIEVNAIEPQCGTTLTLGASGDTVTIPSGATISNLGTAAGFGSTGEVSWNTTKITADPNTATSGVGYFTDTSSAAFNVTLPASPSAGNVVAVADYANTWDTNNLTIARNGSNIEGSASDFVCNTEGAAITFVYVDATKGWVVTNSGNSKDAFTQTFIVATGGTITTCGDFKIHTFTGPGTFCISQVSGCAPLNKVSYVVVAGGGGGGYERAGGGGAGGYRELKGPVDNYTASPLDGSTPITVTAQAYPITVGGAGAARTTPGAPATSGSNSVFSTVTSAGGGGGGSHPSPGGSHLGLAGGSGGGVVAVNLAACTQGGAGNTPPVSPPQGNPAGATNSPTAAGSNYYYASSGGGATAAGSIANGSADTGTGGAGATSSINGTPTARAGGGGGGGNCAPQVQPGGTGGGGAGGMGSTAAVAGTTNTGGGGGGGPGTNPGGGPAFFGANGGSGIVIIRYKFQ